MLENTLDKFGNNLFSWLTGSTKSSQGTYVKKHVDNFPTHGDFSFPNNLKSWYGVVDQNYDNPEETLLHHIHKEASEIVDESIHWNLQVKKVKEEKGRIYLFLHRPVAIHVGLSEAGRNNDLICERLHEQISFVSVDPLSEDSDCVTSLRLKYLTKSVQNLYLTNDHCKDKAPNIIVSPKSLSKKEGCVMLLCGAVLNANTGLKETVINANDFISLRQSEMTLIAQHKYGVRVSTDSKWKEFIAHLGESAVIFELLQTRPSSAVKIHFDCSSAGSSKGASFILYNCARLETIIRTYNQKVNEGTYPPLPDFDAIDFTLLTQEDEWCLIFNYILGLPTLLRNCVEVSERTCEFRPHHICSFLCCMVRVFSQYYRKTRILTEPRTHLLPVLFARIHMLKTLNYTLKTCLKLLNIKSVSQM